MKKEQALEAMKNGEVISHISWKEGEFIREVDGITTNNKGEYVSKSTGDIILTRYDKGWFIIRKGDSPHYYQAEQLLKSIPLHLEDPNRVWCESGHVMEDVISEKIRELHEKIRMDVHYIKELEDEDRGLANEVVKLEENNKTLREENENLHKLHFTHEQNGLSSINKLMEEIDRLEKENYALRERMNHF